MAECLINTMNRQDNSPSDLVVMTGHLPFTLIVFIVRAGGDSLYTESSRCFFGIPP